MRFYSIRVLLLSCLFPFLSNIHAASPSKQTVDSIIQKGIDQVRFNINISKEYVKQLDSQYQLSPTQKAWCNYLKSKIYITETKDLSVNHYDLIVPDTVIYDSLIHYKKGLNLIDRGNTNEGLLILLDFMEKQGKNISDSLSDQINLSIIEVYRVNREFDKAIELLNSIVNSKKSLPTNKAEAYNRMAAIYDSKPGLSFQSRIDSIQKYSELSISLAQTHNLPGLMASSQNELASLYRLNNLDLDRAEKYGESAFANFIGAGMYRNAMNNSIVLSDIFLRKKMYRKALDPCYQVVDLIPIEQNEDMYLRVYLQLAKVYSLLGEYKTAYDFLSVGRLLEKLVTESQTDSHIAEMSAKYSLEIKETQIAHSKQAIEDQKKNTRQLIFIFLLISVTLLFILLYLWTKKKIDLQKHLLDKAEKQNLQMLYEKKSLELKLKNQELVQTLAGNINRTNALKTIKQNVIAGKNPNEIVKVINLNIDTEQNWKKVMLDFQRMYPNFLPALKQQHPELTRNEKRLSVLLFLDITSAEIASILSVSESAISKGRQRLRHKLKLDPSADLGNYFKSFS